MKAEEYRNKMRLAVSGEKNGMYGKKHSEESKQKMSEHSKGKVLGEKNGMYGKKGENAINGLHILMYDNTHTLIKEFASKGSALEYLGLKGHTSLDNAIKTGCLYKNCYWKSYRPSKCRD